MAVVINLHAGGAIIPIILPPEKCISTTWGELCKEFMEIYLPKADPNAIFQILLDISPTKKRLSHYLIRYGDGNSSIIRVDWSSSSGVPGFDPLPFSAAYIDVNMVLKPRVGGNLVNLAKPHLPVQPTTVGGTVSFPSSLHVDLCISVASSAEPPFPYNEDQMSVLYLKEHAIYAGCVDTYEIMAAAEDGNCNRLLGIPHVSQASSAAPTATSTTAGKKQSNKEQTAPTKGKAISSKKRKREGVSNKSDDDEKCTTKPAAKQKEPKKKSPPKVPAATTAKTKKSPPKEPSTTAGLKSPPKKSGEEMIQLYKEVEAAKKLKKSSSSSSKTDSPSIGNEMIRRYNELKEAKAKEQSKKKKSDDSLAKSQSSMKPKESSKKDTTKEGGEGESSKKSSTTTTAAKKSGEGDKAAPSAKAGNEMIRLYMEAKAKENAAAKKDKSTPNKTDDEKTKASSSKKDKSTSDEGESAKKASTPGEEGKSATKKSKAAATEEAEVSKKKKRKAPTTEVETSDAPKSPNKKKAKTSKADGSTSKKDDDTKAVATQKQEPEQKKRGPKRKNYDDIPSEPAEGFPKGWTLKTIPRSTTGYDQRWYAPSGHTFNSKKAARSFEELIFVGLDDSTAYKLFEEKEKKAKDERKAQREAAKKEKAESENTKTAKHINERVTLSKNTSYCRMCYRSQVGLKKSSIEKRKDCKKSKMGCVKCNEPICNGCWRKGHVCKNNSAPGDVGSSAAVDENRNRLYSDFSAEASPAGEGKIPSKKSDDSTKSASSKRTEGSSKTDKAKDDEGQSAKKPSASEKEASPKEEAKASTKKRKASTNAMSSDTLKTPNEKKSKMLKADGASPLKVTFAADVKKSDAPIKTTPVKKSQKRPSKSSAESNDKKLVHCGGCNGCLQDPCRKCSACIANPKRRCKRRPCHKPRFVSIAEYKELMTGLV